MPKRTAKPIGLAIVGAGRIGLTRAEIAAKHPNVEWIGLAEIQTDRGNEVAERVRADFCTTDYRQLLARPEVTAAVIATDEHLHVGPILAAVERRLSLMIEKPLATNLRESARVLQAIQQSGVDAVVGYTQRFRRRFLVAKEKIRTGQLGDVTLVTSRAFMNRLVALDNYRRTDRPETISPMVISGTHALDLVMWLLEGKKPVEAYARSIDKVLGPKYLGIDATAGVITMSDGTIYDLNISWALPIMWPGSVSVRRVCSRSTTRTATSCLPPVLPSQPATRRRPRATSIFSRATHQEMSPSASCGVRCARRRTRGSRAWRSATRHRTRPRQKRTIA